MCSQTDDFKYFVDNHDTLFNLYPNKHLVIQNGKVIIASDTFEDALNKALEKGLELGTFIIQECTEGEEGYTQRFHSRVRFA